MWNTCWTLFKGAAELTAKYTGANLGAAFDVIKAAGDLATGNNLSAAINLVAAIIPQNANSG